MPNYIDIDGNFLGHYPEEDQPVGSFYVPHAPDDAQKVWDFQNKIWVWPVKIMSLVRGNQRDKHFQDVNYKTELVSNLYPKRYFQFGALTKVEWYSDSGLTDLILQVDIAYTTDPSGFVTYRTVTRTWFRPDGSAHPDKKITTKYYTINPQDQLDEAIRRRTNIVRQTDIWLIGNVPDLTVADPLVADKDAATIQADGVAFYETYSTEEHAYTKSGATLLENAVINESDPRYDWFDTDATPLGIPGVSDIRDYIVYQLSRGARNKSGPI